MVMLLSTLDAEAVPFTRHVPERRSLDTTGLATYWTDRPDPWQAAFRRLSDIRGWADDWDGEGAVTPSDALIDSVAQLLLLFRRCGYPSPTSLTATSDGTVVIDWKAGDRYFDIEIVAPYQAEWMAVFPGQPAVHGRDIRAARMELRKVAGGFTR